MKKYAQFIKESIDTSFLEKVNTGEMYRVTGRNNLDGFEKLLKDKFLGNYSRFYNDYDQSWKEIKVVKVEVEKEGFNTSAIYFYDGEGKEYYVHVGYDVFIIKDRVKHEIDMEKKKKKQEEMYHKMKDVDPYGEEEWLDESANEKPKDRTKIMFRGVPLERWRIVLAIKDHAIEFFKNHPNRKEYYYGNIMFYKDEFDIE